MVRLIYGNISCHSLFNNNNTAGKLPSNPCHNLDLLNKHKASLSLCKDDVQSGWGGGGGEGQEESFLNDNRIPEISSQVKYLQFEHFSAILAKEYSKLTYLGNNMKSEINWVKFFFQERLDRLPKQNGGERTGQDIKESSGKKIKIGSGGGWGRGATLDLSS